MNSPQLHLTVPELLNDSADPIVAGDVIWLYENRSTVTVAVVGSFADMFGRSQPTERDARLSHRWIAWIHPDDQARVAQAFELGIHDGHYDQQFRIVLPTRQVRWVHDRALPVTEGRTIRITSDLTIQKRLEETAGVAQGRLNALFENSTDVAFLMDRRAVIQEVSRSSSRVLGLADAVLLGQPILNLIDPMHHDEMRRTLGRALTDPGGSVNFQCRLRKQENEWFWIEGSVRNLLDDLRVGATVINFHDITRVKDNERAMMAVTAELEARVDERTRQIVVANERLREADRQQRLFTRALPEVLVRCDRDTKLLDVMGPVQQMVATRQELLGTRLIDRPELPEDVKNLWLITVHRALDSGRNQICEYVHEVPAGRREFEARLSPVDADEVIAVIQDVTERNRLRERLQHLALHDDLTGLLNRSALRERINDWIGRFPTQPIALLAIDLDRFKEVNDTLGHAIGDTLLKVVANRITRRTGTDALRARVSGDEFAVALPCPAGLEGQSQIETLAQVLITEIGQRMRLHGESLYVTPSVGIAFYPGDGEDTEILLRNADVAMMRAKERGRNGYHFYDVAMSDAAQARHNTEQTLRRAMAAGDMGLVYQPKISVQSGAVIGVEALVRWNTADGTVIAPDRFIPLAERSGLIHSLGRWVLREAVREIANFPTLGRPATDLSVNISVAQLRDPQFVRDVRIALDEFKFPPERLVLEIAETAFVEDMKITADALGNLAALGVRISIDDFGTGYGGLSWLKNLPVHEIKIDRSFIKGCAIDAFDATIVSGLIEIAHNVGIQVVAEGVERADQIAFLTQVKCDVFQGFFVGMPLSAVELIRTHKYWQNSAAA